MLTTTPIMIQFDSSNPPYHDWNDITLIAEAIREGDPPAQRPENMKGYEADLWDLLRDSWNSNPKKRPAIDYVVKRLGILSENL